jgi:phosphoribosylanthranilate isomerase
LTRVKICGITRAEDAQLAAALGAWAVGFVFWPESPRAIDPAAARAIVRDLPPFVAAVGVFVNEPAVRVHQVATEVGLSAVQLHGDEPPEVVDAMQWRVIKAVTLEAPESLSRWPARVTLLVDAHDHARRGGTGRTVDWARAAALARTRRVVLAGGLRPENVGEALRVVAPAAIDVSSGVESSPGIKDAARMRALFDAVGRTEVVS